MNRLFSAAIAALLSLGSFAANAGTYTGTETNKDTILLKLKKADKLMIITNKNQVGVRGLTEYDLNKIVRQVDSVLRNTNTIAYTRDGKGQFHLKDTSILMSTSPGKEPQKSDFKMTIGRDSARNITIRFRDESNGTSDTSIVIKKNKKKKKNYADRSTFYVNVGLNNWIDRSNGKFPDAQGLPHGLRTSGSRYVAIGGSHLIPFANRRYSPAVSIGLELAWYNFMFADDRTIIKDSTGAAGFPLINDLPQYAGRNVNVIKSKLVESVIKVPVGLRFRMARNSSIEVGGYAGYRIGSHTKIKYNGGIKDKERGNFYLNNFQYGLRAQVKVYGVGVFGEYGLQPVFGKGPDLRTVAFGISL